MDPPEISGTLVIPKKQHFLARCSWKPRIADVLKKLKKFKLYDRLVETQFGKLISVADDKRVQFSGHLVHQMLLRRMRVRGEKKTEMHFNVNGTILQFGVKEFAVISGLNFGEYPAKDSHRIDVDSAFVKKYFPVQVTKKTKKVKSVTVGEVETMFNNCKVKEDLWKLGLLCVIYTFVFAEERGHPVDMRLVNMVDNVDAFTSYPWGKVAFCYTLKKCLKKDLVDLLRRFNSKDKDEVRYTIYGLGIVFQAWIYEVVPSFIPVFASRDEPSGPVCPRILLFKSDEKLLLVNDILAKFRSAKAKPMAITPEEEELYKSAHELENNFLIGREYDIDEELDVEDSNDDFVDPPPVARAGKKRSREVCAVADSDDDFENPPPRKRCTVPSTSGNSERVATQGDVQELALKFAALETGQVKIQLEIASLKADIAIQLSSMMSALHTMEGTLVRKIESMSLGKVPEGGKRKVNRQIFEEESGNITSWFEEQCAGLFDSEQANNVSHKEREPRLSEEVPAVEEIITNNVAENDTEPMMTVELTSDEVITSGGGKGQEVVTEEGRTIFEEGLVEDCDSDSDPEWMSEPPMMRTPSTRRRMLEEHAIYNASIAATAIPEKAPRGPCTDIIVFTPPNFMTPPRIAGPSSSSRSSSQVHLSILGKAGTSGAVYSCWADAKDIVNALAEAMDDAAKEQKDVADQHTSVQEGEKDVAMAEALVSVQEGENDVVMAEALVSVQDGEKDVAAVIDSVQEGEKDGAPLKAYGRKKKRPVYLDAYTDPPTASLVDGSEALVINHEKPVDPTEYKTMMKWVNAKKGKASQEADEIDGKSVLISKQDLKSLMKKGNWITNTHLEVALSLLRKRVHAYPSTYPQLNRKFSILNTQFASNFKAKFAEFEKDKPGFVFTPSMTDFYHGLPRTRLMPAFWKVDDVYFPLNILDHHWILCVFRVKEWVIDVYDCDTNLYRDPELAPHMQPVVEMIPYLFRQEMINKGIVNLDPVPYSRKNVPHAPTGGDCGMFVLMYVEYLIAGMDVNAVVQAKMPLFRKKWATRFFYHDIKP